MLPQWDWCSINGRTVFSSDGREEVLLMKEGRALGVRPSGATRSNELGGGCRKVVQRVSGRQPFLQPQRTLTATGPGLIRSVGVAVFHPLRSFLRPRYEIVHVEAEHRY